MYQACSRVVRRTICSSTALIFPFRIISQDSPIFNFINNLSPIQPVKSLHGAHIFQSLSFASISSVFSSPHINAQKESRFSIRHPYSDSSKPDISPDNLDESNLCPALSDAIDPAIARENCSITCSLNEATVDPPEECSTQPSNLPHPIPHDSGSPNHNTKPCYGDKIELKLETGHTPVEVAHVVYGGVEKRKLVSATEIKVLNFSATEINVSNDHHATQNKEDVAATDWDDLISEDADDLLIFDSSTDLDGCNDQEEKFQNNNESKPVDAIDHYPQNAARYFSVGNSKEAIDEHGTDHTPQMLSGTSQSQVVSNNQNLESGNENDSGFSVDCKVESQQQRGMRRRCLTFELAAGFTKNSNKNSNLYNSISLPSSRKLTSDDQKSIFLKTGSGSLSRVWPGIGLHLNTLSTTSTDRMVTEETPAFGKRFISLSCSISQFPPITDAQKYPDEFLDVGKDQYPTVSEARDLEATHDDVSEAPDIGVGENLSQSSPKKKKRKSENGGESEACKRCNCKKSKCLKLYCECFAAGIYCVDPCSCQGCFNKPIHEEIVLNTRKQIESRNPLAFAPKVIRASEPVQYMGEEANKTPASGRHKRGCNCKKSSCLKKYCECFQVGVGCSPSCRCEGCKNAFGRKDAVDEVGPAEEVIDGSEKQHDELHEDQQYDISQKNNLSPESTLPRTPFEICRPFVRPPFLSSGKPPRASMLSLGGPTLQTLRRCQFPLQHKIANHFKPLSEDDTPEILRGDASPKNGVKTISPNGKRVSPPHTARGISPNRKGGRKLILKSIPSFPSLNGDLSNEHQMNYSSSQCTSSELN